jgi:2-methylcitrate dehydratase PrpD
VRRPIARRRLSRREILRQILIAAAAAALPPRLVLAQSAADSSAASPLALELARFLHAVRFNDLPHAAVEHAKIVVASTLASAAVGSRIESARIVRALAEEQGGRAEASVWYARTRLPIAQAARVNAMQSDASASDDSDLRNVAHSGTTVAAVGLALGERARTSGRDVLAAMVAGYEAAGRISETLMTRQEFHASMAVAFGGTVTAARLLGLTAEEMAHALALTATTVGGLAMGTDSWAREYHAGNAALTAVNAALAAGRGFTANPDMLEARRGFLATFGGADVEPSRLVRNLGDEWDIVTHLAIKLVPGAHAFHPAVEAAVDAARRANVPPDRIARILVSGPRHRSLPVERPPADLVEAIHSLPYFLASAVADRDFSWAHATPEKISSAPMAALIGRVAVDPAPPTVRYEWSWGATVTIETTTGERFTSTVDAPRASGPRGIEWRDVDAKYFALMPDSGLPASRIERALDLVHTLEDVRDVGELAALVTSS